MRSSLFVLTIATLGAISGIANAQDAPPAGPPPAAGPPPGAAPPPGGPPPGAVMAPMPGPDMPRGDEERTANNAVYLELLGPGGFYSINYDRAFGDFAGRIGFSYISVSASNGLETASASWLSVPITFSYLGIGSKTHMLEVGAGVTLWSFGAGASGFGAGSAGASAMLIAPTGVVGYRMQPKDGGFFFKVGVSPMFITGGDDSVFWIAPHLALGGTF